MKDDDHKFSRKRIDELHRAADAISRARAATPVAGNAGRDVLKTPGSPRRSW